MRFKRPQSLKKSPSVVSPFSPYLALFNGTVLLTGTTWATYLVGSAYHKALLSEVGIDSSLYPKQASEYFVFAYYAYIDSLGVLLTPLIRNPVVAGIILAAWVGVMFSVLVILVLEKNSVLKGVKLNLTKNQRLRRVLFTLFFPVFGAVLTISLPLTLTMIILVPAAVGEAAGVRKAERYFHLATKECEFVVRVISPCTEVIEKGNVVAFGIVVDASEKYVAIFEKNGSRSIILDGKELRRRRLEGDGKPQG